MSNSKSEISISRPNAGEGKHPVILPRKVGVVLVNLGTPDATDYWSMRRYLNEFLGDRRVIDLPRYFWQPLLQLIILTKRPFSSGKAYQSIWNKELDESPLLTISREQAKKLAIELESKYKGQVVVDFAMRYGSPSTESVLNRLQKQGCDRILFFPLYPQYAAPTTATANDHAFRALMKMTWQPAFRTVPAYFDRPDYINALANSVKEAYANCKFTPEKLIASYHGMPLRYLMEGDPYHCQCIKTTRLLKEKLAWQDGQLESTFQSKFGKEVWLQPYTVERVSELAKSGVTKLAIMAPAFASDCVETLEEIQEEIAEAFYENGGKEFMYIPCLNDQPDHIKVLKNIVETETKGWLKK